MIAKTLVTYGPWGIAAAVVVIMIVNGYGIDIGPRDKRNRK